MWRDARFAVILLTLVTLAIALMFARPMILIGSAFDPDGVPVPGTFAYSRSGTFGMARSAAEGSTSNRFFAACLLCVSLDARVLADGFETEEVRISPHFDEAYGDRLDVWRGPFALFSHARVTLYPQQQIDAQHYRGELVFEQGAATRVLSLHEAVSGSDAPRALQQRLRQETRGRETVLPYVALEAATNADGSIALAEVGGHTRPAELRLVLYGAEGGFLQVAPLTGLPDYNGYRETVRRLREAPEAGYVSDIALDPALAHLDGNHYYLFIRIDDRYGRIELPVPAVAAVGGGQVSVGIELVVNAAGGRALPFR